MCADKIYLNKEEDIYICIRACVYVHCLSFLLKCICVYVCIIIVSIKLSKFSTYNMIEEKFFETK